MQNFLFFIFISIFLFTGCATLTSKNKDEIVEFDKKLAQNSCDYSFVNKKLEDNDDPILWLQQGGAQARNCGDFNKSIEFFDSVEYLYKYDVDFKNQLTKVGETTKSILLNNNANPYDGNIYEKIMVNTYKGLSFLALGNKDSARVEFNRALERQIIAKEYFAKEIQDDINKKNKTLLKLRNDQDSYNSYVTNKASKSRTYNAEKLSFNDNAMNQIMNYTKNDNADIYPDFVNPFTTYISALFSFLDGNNERASFLFREGLQMDSSNIQIAKDYSLVEEIIKRGRFDQRYVWVIYESGFSASLEEVRVDLPLFFVSSRYFYTGIAFPQILPRSNSHSYLKIKNSSGDEAQTYVVANFDNIIKAEFDKRFFGLISEVIVSVAIKTIAQKYIKEQDSILGLAASFYQQLSTRADLRSWSSLPKYFSSGRIPIKDGEITIYSDRDNLLYKTIINNNKNAIIYIKSSHVNQILVHEIYF